MIKVIKKHSLDSFFGPVKNRIPMVAAVTAVFLGGAVFFEFFSPRLYRATAVVQLDSFDEHAPSEPDYIYGMPSLRRKIQIEFLYSPELARQVADRLGINIEYLEEALVSKDVFLKKVEKAEKDRRTEIEVIGKSPLETSRLANVWAEEFVSREAGYSKTAVQQQILKTHRQLFSILNKLQEIKSNLIDFIEENNLASQEEQKPYAEENLEIKKPYLEEQIMAKSRFYKDKHPEMVELKEKLKEIEEKLKEKETDKLFSLHNTASQYKILSKEFENYSSLYERSIRYLQELSDYESNIKKEARITKKAHPPTEPINPGSRWTVLLAGFLGLLAGSLASFSLRYLDHTIRSDKDIEHLTGMRPLGELLYMKKEESPEIICHLRPNSRLGEFFREIKAGPYFKAPKILGVTSAIHKEGKTLVVSNLGICFAHDNEKVLLVDADMRKGRLAEIHGIENNKGLVGILKNEIAAEDVIVPTKIPNLYIIPKGFCVCSPQELLLSHRLKEVLAGLTGEFDRIIVDTPPVLHVADTLMLSNACEGFVFVIKALCTPLKHVKKARDVLRDKARIIGAIVNGFKTL